MRYAIPLLANRISPRCTIAEGILIIEARDESIVSQIIVPLVGRSWTDLLGVLAAERIDTLVCNGIARAARQELEARGIAVVENVAATAVSVVEAIATGALRPGFGFGEPESAPAVVTAPMAIPAASSEIRGGLDCLACRDLVCLRGEQCPHFDRGSSAGATPEQLRMLEATYDIASEPVGRTLCRLTELIYFGLETHVTRLGVAFCWDLAEATRILVGVLRRFFEVIPVGCRINGIPPGDAAIDADWRGVADGTNGTDSTDGTDTTDAAATAACDPLAQAAALAKAGCQLNVLVGLCIGADCVLTGASRVPVTTLFVKDRSLANNPIGALYSEYYLKEALRAASEVRA